MNGLNDRIYIEGGHQLKGSIRIQGSKNAALPMMAVSFTSGSQCAQRLSADRGCFLYGGNSSEAWGSDLVGRP